MVLYFSAAWCQPCTVFGPIVDKVFAEEGVEYRKLDIDTPEGFEYGYQYNVLSIPTLVAENGEELKGAVDEERLRNWVRNACRCAETVA